jgi:homospermidine synthase
VIILLPMSDHVRYVKFTGRLVIVGFGTIGRGVLPLLLRHIEMQPEQITIITASESGAEIAAEYGATFIVQPLTRANYMATLDNLIGPGDFLLNLSVDVSSVALIEYCRHKSALYLDTCIEPWAGVYADGSLSPSQRSSYALRESAVALRAQNLHMSTAVLTHGANPGLVSHLVKQGLMNLARDAEIGDAPSSRTEWAELARTLGVKVIHVAEHDTQVSCMPKRPGEFVNTWSVEGFVSEGLQPAELGWGSHELHFPADGARHDFGCQSAIYLNRPGALTRVRSWTPLEGPYYGFLTAHGESISIADYFSIGDGRHASYRPTVHYAYHPCDNAVLSLLELASKNWRLQGHHRLMMDEIVDGVDELGILLMGCRKGVYWYGSRLSIHEARRLAPHNNATSLQVTAAVLAGVIWAIENPCAGIIEPEDMDYRRILEICIPYLGEVVGVYGDWTPLADRGRLFIEELDKEDLWQFKNFRVI